MNKEKLLELLSLFKNSRKKLHKFKISTYIRRFQFHFKFKKTKAKMY